MGVPKTAAVRFLPNSCVLYSGGFGLTMSDNEVDPQVEEKPEKKEKKEKKHHKKDGEKKEKKHKKKHRKDGEKREKKEKKDKKKEDEVSDSEDDNKQFEEKYDIGDELGRGAFSVVKKCVSKNSGKTYAVKVIEKKNVGQDMARLRTEIEILKRVKHPNIIRLKEIRENEDTLFIVTEIVTGGELFDKIVELGAYTEADAAKLVLKMVSAIDYLHDMNIVHRDLKPENLLLKSTEDVSEIKLADFGLSKIVGQKVMMQTACGTPGYVAPEVLNATGYDKEVDLWSIGVITYILLCGFPPFYNESLPLLFEQIMKADFDYPPDYWDEISDQAKDFIDKLLVVDPQKRMTTKDALAHKWLAGAAPNKKLSKVGGKMKASNKKRRDEATVKGD